jgi:hypothetical protein
MTETETKLLGYRLIEFGGEKFPFYLPLRQRALFSDLRLENKHEKICDFLMARFREGYVKSFEKNGTPWAEKDLMAHMRNLEEVMVDDYDGMYMEILMALRIVDRAGYTALKEKIAGAAEAHVESVTHV